MDRKNYLNSRETKEVKSHGLVMDWALLWRDEGVASPYFTGWPSGIYKEC